MTCFVSHTSGDCRNVHDLSEWWKARLHFDLRPREGTRDEQVERLVASGATVAEDLRECTDRVPAGSVSADLEGTSSASCARSRSSRSHDA